MSYSGYAAPQGGPPQSCKLYCLPSYAQDIDVSSDSPQPGYGPPPGQYNQVSPQGAYPPPVGYPPQGYAPQQQGYGAPQETGYPQQQQGYGAPPGGGQPPQQGLYGASPPQGQWGQPPRQQQDYGQAPPPGQYGQAPPLTPPYSGSFPPAPGHPQAGQFPPPQLGAYSRVPTTQYPPPHQVGGPSAPPSPGYDLRTIAPMDMTPIAMKLRAALKGWSADHSTLVEVLSRLDPLQVAGLRQAYNSHVRRDLEKDIESKTSSHYRDASLAIVRGPLLHDAHCVKRAVEGVGTNESMLNDVLVGRSNADMQAIQLAYFNTFNRDMLKDVRSDLSMKTEQHFVMIMKADRDEESAPVLPHKVEQDVNALYKTTKDGTAGLDVCEILTKRSDGQIRAIAQLYQQRFQTSLDAVIRKNFSSHMEDVLLLQLARATDRAMSDAMQLEEAMKGLGTKDELLVQRVVRAHWNRQHLQQVKAAYDYKFKTKGGLAKRVKGEVSGHYEDLLLACLA